MMRLFSLVMCALMTLCASAMVIPKGTFYFDNSKTKYANGSGYQCCKNIWCA